ncbi:hypothetical protein [Providencia phage PSTCR6]|nr:hypothetical protein [Providencia phage PSTCR6]
MLETIIIFSVLHLIALTLILLPFEDSLIRTTEFNFITVFFIVNMLINPILLILGLFTFLYELPNWMREMKSNKEEEFKACEEDRKQYVNACRKLIK